MQFLSVLAERNIHIPTWEKAVEGISGAAVVYLIFATILTCCLGGISFLAILAIVLDLLFCAGMVAIAVLTRDGAHSCKGLVQTPLGNGQASQDNGFGGNGFGSGTGENVTYAVHLGLACRYNKAVFAVSIIAAILFLCTAASQIMLLRHHKKEKRYGPSPSNNYTSGKGSRFGRKKASPTTMKQAEAGNGGYASTAPVAHNNQTAYTGTTAAPSSGYTYDRPTGNQPNALPPQGTHGGYYTAPTGTAAHNPYGYNNTSTNY